MSVKLGVDGIKAMFGEDALMLLLNRASVTEKALRERFANKLTREEVDLSFLHYLYGFVETHQPALEPTYQIAVLRYVADDIIPPMAAEAAICRVPDAGHPILQRVIRTVESLGRRDAETFQPNL
ncbi:hypothetical protein [Pseudochrobactrum sp. MP213Fo]|uniref:hypothetical protein n=1 Tax=Pseudochrobactrum sp. MP213Fo TaxID=3022250 RepID=UPI003B9F0570